MSGPGDDTEARDGEAAEVYDEAAARLADALDRAVAPWIIRMLHERVTSTSTVAPRGRLEVDIDAVARQIHADVVPRLHRLLTTDVDQQSATPLGLLRDCVGPANRLLDEAGVARPDRDPVTASMFPDDPHALGPATFDDVDETLHDVGLVWGAAKAHLVLSRHHGR